MSVGFCARCGFVRQDDEYGWPVTPCACFVEHHAKDCKLRVAINLKLALACKAHGADSCPECNACSCGVAADQQFVCGRHAFTWEAGVGLMPTEATVRAAARPVPG